MREDGGSGWQLVAIGLNCLYWIASFAVADEGRRKEIGSIDSEAYCFVLYLCYC